MTLQMQWAVLEANKSTGVSAQQIRRQAYVLEANTSTGVSAQSLGLTCTYEYIHIYHPVLYISIYTHGVATISRLLKIVGLCCRISSLL